MFFQKYRKDSSIILIQTLTNLFINNENTQMQTNKHYTLTLKINNKYVDIKLNLHDTRHTIQQKISIVCPEHKIGIDDLVTKIKKQLASLSNRVEAREEARQLAKEIVSKIYKEERSPIQEEWALSQIGVNSRVKSCVSDILTLPEKICDQKCIQTQQTQPAEQYFYKLSNNKSFSAHSLIKTETEVSKRQERTKKMSLNMMKKPTKASTSKQQKESRKKCNPDMIKACEVIMKKSNHNAMKMMAKEFLKQKGYLAEDVISHQREKRRTYLVSQVSENPQNQKIVREKQSQQRRQRHRTIQSNILIESKSVNITELALRNPKMRSKYSYNITPTAQLFSYSLNASYQNQPKAKITQTSIQKYSKKYNYLQN